MQIEVATVVDRPVADVWHWYADDHVRNHPRWDPEMELEQISDGTIRLGTRIRRTNTRFGTPVQGEMEVVEWDRPRALAMAIHDSNMEMHARATFEPDGPDKTLLTISTEMPDMEESVVGVVRGRMERTIANVKALIESDV
jgi:polyketide cyclase/dehydrase/lipid transport protein